jgi:hypothetical protein
MSRRESGNRQDAKAQTVRQENLPFLALPLPCVFAPGAWTVKAAATPRLGRDIAVHQPAPGGFRKMCDNNFLQVRAA